MKLFVITKDARLPLVALLFWFALRLSGVAYPVSYSHEYLIWGLFAAWFFGSAYGNRKLHFVFAGVCSFYILLFCAWNVGEISSPRIWVRPPAYAEFSAAAKNLEEDKLLVGSEVLIALPAGNSSVDVFFGEKRKTIEGPRHQEEIITLEAPQKDYARPVRLLLRDGLVFKGSRHFMLVPDRRPKISFIAEPVVTTRKITQISYKAQDDYGLSGLGLRVYAPDNAAEFIDLPFDSFVGAHLQESQSVDLTSLPWRGKEVAFSLYAKDLAGQEALSEKKKIKIPQRYFQNAFARALIEEREKLKENITEQKLEEAANIMAGLARQQGLFGGDPVVMLALRAAAVRLILNEEPNAIPETRRLMWNVAVRLDEGKIGLAQGALARAEANLTSALKQKAEASTIQIFQTRLHKALEGYLAAVRREMSRQPEELRAVAWPLATRYGVLSPQDLKAHLIAIDAHIKKDRRKEALTELSSLRGQIENLRTTPPELSKEQFSLLEQTATLSKVVQILKDISQITEKLLLEKPQASKAPQKWKDKVLDVAKKQEEVRKILVGLLARLYQPARLDAAAGDKALRHAGNLLKEGKLFGAQQAQAEALGLLENALLALSEQSRAALVKDKAQ